MGPHLRGIIDLNDAVHAVQGEDDLVEHWDGSANEASVATLGHNCQPPPITIAEDLRNLP